MKSSRARLRRRTRGAVERVCRRVRCDGARHAEVEIVRPLHFGDRHFDQHLQRPKIDAADDLLNERPVGVGRANEQRVRSIPRR